MMNLSAIPWNYILKTVKQVADDLDISSSMLLLQPFPAVFSYGI
jgi:hypothetical protein